MRLAGYLRLYTEYGFGKEEEEYGKEKGKG